jgi:hypothetical protein
MKLPRAACATHTGNTAGMGGTGYNVKTALTTARMTSLRVVFQVPNLNIGMYLVSLVGNVDSGAVYFINGVEGSR